MNLLWASFAPVSYRIGGPLTPMVRRLLIANGVVFFLEVIAFAIPVGARLSGYRLMLEFFGLVPADVLQRGWIWQLGTYMFLHSVGGFLPLHLILNMLMLWIFGGDLERSWGSREFLRYYLFTGVGAGLTVLAVTPGSPIPTIGASGALYGILMAYGMLFPNRIVLLYFVFPVRVKWLVLFAGLLTLYASLTQPGGGVSHLAHLGGLVFGWIYLKRAWRLRQLIAELRWHYRRRRFRVHEDDRSDGGRYH
ncbi:MAG: rhomboid family intramembrane serine protease [Acidobacteriota bacterium]